MTVSSEQQILDRRPASVLTIAGSDSGGGAGIQADLKTFAAHGLHGLSAIAALTAQNTREVRAVHSPAPDFLTTQLEVLFEDFRIVAVKVGMLATTELVDAVVGALRGRAVPLVVDPVMIASSGASLLATDAVTALRERLIPRADLITPNLPEAEALLGHRIAGREAMPAAAQALLQLGPRAVLLKGGHLEGDDDLLDLYRDAQRSESFVHPRLAREGHGTGCTLSSAIASELASGRDRVEACRRACDYVHGALRHAYRPGRGTVAVLDHFWRQRAGT